MTQTVLDAIRDGIVSALANDPNVRVDPVVLLWPDAGGQWQPVVDRLRAVLPIVTLGEYEPGVAKGPAYWIRCAVSGARDGGLPSGTPIIYLPGVSRSDLRAVEECPPEIAPIAELQYRGQWFSHPNAKDWSVKSFLKHENGLNLRLSDDTETAQVLLLALDRILGLPLGRISNQFVDAAYLRDQIDPDPVSSILRWLGDPAAFKASCAAAQWTAFEQTCQSDYGLKPDLDGPITAAQLFGGREGPWANVWARFAEAPERYLGVPDRLREARPQQFFVEARDVWPQDNEDGEAQLRSALLDLQAGTAEGARAEVMVLEGEHQWRRGTVWAELDQAPLAFALEQLARLAEIAQKPQGQGDVDSITKAYYEHGWQADDAVLRALAAAPQQHDRAAVAVAVRVLYWPWLDSTARALQDAIPTAVGNGFYKPTGAVALEPGTVALFADGMRLDMAHRLSARLASAGYECALEPSLAALPTVTATAKAAVAPLPPGSLASGPEFAPTNAETGNRVTVQVLRSLLTKNGIDVISAGELGDPSGRGWTELGEVDRRGHELGVRLVDYVDDEIERVRVRVEELLAAGWESVKIVTDHGWILLPGGMPTEPLNIAVAEKRKGRCARLKDGADVAVPTVPWYWNDETRIALARGASCFEANKDYEHGGVSPQECVVPRMVVRAKPVPTTVAIRAVKWLGMMCRIDLAGAPSGARVDIRAQPASQSTSVAEQGKETVGDGRVSLFVSDEDLLGERAFLVVVSAPGELLSQRELIIGRNR